MTPTSDNEFEAPASSLPQSSPPVPIPTPNPFSIANPPVSPSTFLNEIELAASESVHSHVQELPQEHEDTMLSSPFTPYQPDNDQEDALELPVGSPAGTSELPAPTQEPFSTGTTSFSALTNIFESVFSPTGIMHSYAIQSLFAGAIYAGNGLLPAHPPVEPILSSSHSNELGDFTEGADHATTSVQQQQPMMPIAFIDEPTSDGQTGTSPSDPTSSEPPVLQQTSIADDATISGNNIAPSGIAQDTDPACMCDCNCFDAIRAVMNWVISKFI